MLPHELPSGPGRPPINHDKADTYRNSVAWREMKKLYGKQFHLDRIFAAMERLYPCAEVRMFMAVALHHWLNLTPEERQKAYHEFNVYCAEQSAIHMAEQGYFKQLEQFEEWRREYRQQQGLEEETVDFDWDED